MKDQYPKDIRAKELSQEKSSIKDKSMLTLGLLIFIVAGYFFIKYEISLYRHENNKPTCSDYAKYGIDDSNTYCDGD